MHPFVPYADLVAEWLPLKSEALRRIQTVFEHGKFVMGPEVLELESRLAQDVGVSHAVVCSSGTTALQMALMALDLAPGDEVILPAFTFAAPLEVVLLLGLRAVLADVDPINYTIDVNSVASLITPQTRAIIAVSLYGNPADLTALNALANQHHIAVIEDAAQSYGAALDGRRSGGLSTMGCVSFFPTKPLGGGGDGGAVLTNDPALAQRVTQVRDHGQSGKYKHVRLGINGRLDSIACAMLLVRLGGFAKALAQRQKVARRYDALLSELAYKGLVQLPSVRAGAQSSYAQYAVQVMARDAVVDAMQLANVEVAVHYPEPLHTQSAFNSRVFFGALTNAERIAQHVLCLPIYPTLRLSQQERVARVLAEVLCGSKQL